MSLATCAFGRIASIVRCIISVAVGSSGCGAAFGVGFGASIAAADLSWVIISWLFFSSVSTFCVATASSAVALSLGSAGSGVLARRLASVLPPPSRFAWARMSALVGLETDLALTSATSSGEASRSNLLKSIGAKRIASTTACRHIEPIIAHMSKRLPRAGSSARNDSDMVRGSGVGSARTRGLAAGFSVGASDVVGGTAATTARKWGLLVALGITRKYMPPMNPRFRAAGCPSDDSGATRWQLWASLGGADKTRLDSRGKKVDLSHPDADPRPGRQRRHLGGTNIQRNPVEPDQIVADDGGLALGDIFLLQPAQAPVVLQ